MIATCPPTQLHCISSFVSGLVAGLSYEYIGSAKQVQSATDTQPGSELKHRFSERAASSGHLARSTSSSPHSSMSVATLMSANGEDCSGHSDHRSITVPKQCDSIETQFHDGSRNVMNNNHQLDARLANNCQHGQVASKANLNMNNNRF